MTMKINKNVILIVVLVAIASGIYYLESKKVDRSADFEVVEVKPRVEVGQPTAQSAQAPAVPTAPSSPTTPAPSGTNVTSSGSGNATPSSPSTFAAPQTVSGNLSQSEKAARYPLAKEITTPDGFINTNGDSIRISDYIGKKVILVDFWTYSCINCIRTFPFLNAWWTKYKDHGLVMIGIHTPEFEFEKDFNNVKDAVADLEIKFPVVLDNDFSTWSAYQNRFWPRKYLIDIDGYIVYDHIGEGAYAETEEKIQELLKERNEVLGLEDTYEQAISNPDGATTFTQAQSPEIYFGSSRNSLLANGASGVTGEQNLDAPDNPLKNLLYLDGEWDIRPEYAESQTDDAKIVFRYRAKNVFIVASSDDGAIVNIRIDGKSLGDDAGQDTELVGGVDQVEIGESRLYRLVEHDSAEEHVLEITVTEGELKAFTFTFG